MCKVGDIIVVRNYLSQGQTIKRHSFVVLSTEHGEIQGMDFDLVCNVMSSFRSEEQGRWDIREILSIRPMPRILEMDMEDQDT